jgi:hypothetical protein
LTLLFPAMYFRIVAVILFLASSALHAQQKYTLSGFIKDTLSGEELIGASIYIDELKMGAVTNVYGFYSLTLVSGNYTLRIQYLGYETKTQPVNLNKNTTLNFELSATSKKLQTIEVKAERVAENLKTVEMSVTQLSIQTIKKIPALFGEVDIIRTLSMLPGVVNAGEGVGGFYVRGGGVDQNLVLLDEAIVFNASHMLGFFSVFSSDIVKDVKLYSGGIPAEYGGRLSSVLDVRMKEGNLKKYSVSGGIGLISSRLMVEGPIKKDKASFIVSGRRTYSDLLIKLARDPEMRKNQLYFYDLNTKINWKISERDRIYVSSYFGRDVFKFTNLFRIQWGNATATARWNHLFSEKLFSNLTFVFSDYQYALGELSGPTAFEWQSKIRNFSLKYDFTHYINPNNTLKYGLQATYYKFFPGELTPQSTNEILNPIKVPEKNAVEAAAYVSNEQRLGKKVTLQYGLRYSNFNVVGKGKKYIYGEDGKTVVDTIQYGKLQHIQMYHGLEPRFAARYEFLRNNALKLSYMRTKQYLHLISNSTVSSPLDIWVPSGPYIKPMTGNQVALGFFKNFFNNELETSFEGFYKHMQDVIDYKDNAELLLNDKIEQEVLRGKGYAYGLEFLVKRNAGRINGWVSYTISRTRRKIPGINDGNEYPATYDRTHNVNVVLSVEASKRVDVGATWTYNTGLAVTFPSGKFVYGGNIYPVFTERNGYRMPAYHRMDLSCTLKRKNAENKKWYYEWSFSIYNVYYRKNAFSITFEEDDGKTVAKKIYLFAIVPSISWNFKF